MFGVTAVPACFFFVLMFLSRRARGGWSRMASRPRVAVLARIGGDTFADREIQSIEATLVGEIEKVHFRDLLQPRMFAILGIGVALAVLQQWCGINVIFYYAASLFSMAGFNVADALLNIVIIGAVNLVFTVLAVWSVDRVGRRALMLLGFAGLTVTHLAIDASFYAGQGGVFLLVLTLAAIGCYGLTLAPVTWVVLVGDFPQPHPRGGHVGLRLLPLDRLLPPDLHLSAAPGEPRHGVDLLALRRNLRAAGSSTPGRRLPETKGKTPEEIERELVDIDRCRRSL